MSSAAIIGPKLVDVCPAFRAKMKEFARLAMTDHAAANVAFEEAQAIARAFRAKGGK